MRGEKKEKGGSSCGGGRKRERTEESRIIEGAAGRWAAAVGGRRLRSLVFRLSCPPLHTLRDLKPTTFVCFLLATPLALRYLKLRRLRRPTCPSYLCFAYLLSITLLTLPSHSSLSSPSNHSTRPPAKTRPAGSPTRSGTRGRCWSRVASVLRSRVGAKEEFGRERSDDAISAWLPNLGGVQLRGREEGSISKQAT